MELDMTKGNPLKLIIRFVIPVILGNVFQQLYNMVDSIIVGRCINLDALAAVGATGTISFLILGFTTGLTAGFTVIVAQKFGAGDMEGVKRATYNTVLLSCIATIIVTILSAIGLKPLLTAMHTPENVFDMSYQYISIICYGLVFTVLYNLCASLLRSIGNSKIPLYFLIVSVFINVVLDIVFIVPLKMGVRGAALATILSQGISGILCLFYIFKKVKLLVPEKRHCHADWMIIRSQLHIGPPMALQYAITASGTILVQAALNCFGSVVMASYTAAGKVVQLMTLSYSALGVTMSTYAAQNLGVNNTARIKKGTIDANILSAVYSIIMYALALVLLSPLMKLFVSAEETVPFETIFSYGRTYVIYAGTCFIPLGMIFIFRNCMQGCAFSFAAMSGGIVELVSRAVVSLFATKLMSYKLACAADPITWLITGIYFIIAYMFTVNRLDKKNKKKSLE